LVLSVIWRFKVLSGKRDFRLLSGSAERLQHALNSSSCVEPAEAEVFYLQEFVYAVMGTLTTEP
jgi:hypothetical protein